MFLLYICHLRIAIGGIRRLLGRRLSLIDLHRLCSRTGLIEKLFRVIIGFDHLCFSVNHTLGLCGNNLYMKRSFCSVVTDIDMSLYVLTECGKVLPNTSVRVFRVLHLCSPLQIDYFFCKGSWPLTFRSGFSLSRTLLHSLWTVFGMSHAFVVYRNHLIHFSHGFDSLFCPLLIYHIGSENIIYLKYRSPIVHVCFLSDCIR